MRVLQKRILDCPIDEAIDAITNPRVLREILTPIVMLNSVEPGGLPHRWRDGDDHRVYMRALGVIPLGVQMIGARMAPRRDDVVMLRDVGPATGMFTAWDHRLAVSPLPDGRTLYRDQLRFSCGAITLPVWPLMWALWQWRAAKLQRMFAATPRRP